MKRVAFIFCCWLNLLAAGAQTPPVQAIYARLAELSGGARLDYVAENLATINNYHPDTVKYFAEQAAAYARKTELKHYEGLSSYFLANYYSNAGELGKSLLEGNRARQIFELDRDTANLARVYNELGITHYLLSDHEKGAAFLEKALRLLQYQGNKKAAIGIKSNLANIYAIFDQRKALALSRELLTETDPADYDMLAVIQNNLSLRYSYFDSYDSAAYYLKAAERNYLKTGNREGLSDVYANQAEVLHALGRPAEAEPLIRKAIGFAQALKNQDMLAGDLYILAVNLRRQGKFMAALAVLTEGRELVEKHGIVSYRENYLLERSELEEAMGNYRAAITAYKRFVLEHERTRQAEAARHLAALRTLHETREKMLEIEALKKDRALRELRTARTYLLAAFILFSALLASLYLWQRRRREQVIARQQQAILQLRLEEERLLKENLQAELFYKNSQLVTKTLQLSEKSAFVDELSEAVQTVKTALPAEFSGSLNRVRQLLSASSLEQDWETFRLHFDQLHPGFVNLLQKAGAGLTQAETRLAVLIRLSLGTKDCANILHISPESVKTARYRLKKKLGLPAEASLDDYITALA